MTKFLQASSYPSQQYCPIDDDTSAYSLEFLTSWILSRHSLVSNFLLKVEQYLDFCKSNAWEGSINYAHKAKTPFRVLV